MREAGPVRGAAGTGLLAGFGLQAMVNMFSTLHDADQGHDIAVHFVRRLFGGRGRLGMGMLLSLTRRRHHGEVP